MNKEEFQAAYIRALGTGREKIIKFITKKKDMKGIIFTKSKINHITQEINIQEVWGIKVHLG